MDAGLRRALVRWLLLASVVFGIAVMHHLMADHSLVATTHATSSSMANLPTDQEPTPDPTPPHDVLHQCMAVIGHNGIALIVLLLLIGVVALRTPTRATDQKALGRAPARPPPRLAGRALLHAVCIARL